MKRLPRTKVRGAIMIIAALAVPMACGFAALAVDLGYLFFERSQLQNTADASALACATALPGNTTDARNIGDDYIDRNKVYNADVAIRRVQTGRWDGKRFVQTSSHEANSCHVEVAMDNKLFFGPVIGVNTARVNAEATATRTPGDANISLVLDNSTSMGDAVSGVPAISALKRATLALIDWVSTAPGKQAMALTTFSTDVDPTKQPQQVMTQNLELLRQKVRTMQADGGTNIARAIFMGTRVAFTGPGAQRVRGGRNLLILLSDGFATCKYCNEVDTTCENSLTSRTCDVSVVRRCTGPVDFLPGCRPMIDPSVVKSATASAVCEADRAKQYKVDPSQEENLMVVTVSLGQCTDRDAMGEMASPDLCPKTANNVKRDCPAGSPNCCHYVAPTPQNIETVFREILSNGPVRLVE